MRVLLLNNRLKPHTVHMAEQMELKLKAMGAEVFIDNGVQKPGPVCIDLLIVLGGDGTVIRAAREYAQSGVPVLGVNMGRVGFLSNIASNQLEENLERLLKQDYSIDERMVMEVEVLDGDLPIMTVGGLNEVVFRSTAPRIVELMLYVKERSQGVYRGDGLIVATPTGSTAYSLSAGGPIVDPSLQAFVVTPIASSITHRRPLVIGAQHPLVIKPRDARDAVICVDGQIQMDFEPEYSVRIQQAANPLRMVNLTGALLFDNLEGRLRRNEVK